MKKTLTLILCIAILPSVFGQKLDYDHDSKWFFGLNAGAAWNTTDVKNKTHIGYGFTLGRSFNYNYGKKFSFDLRLRYLGGKWYGQDYDTTNVTGNSGYDPMGNVTQRYDTTLGYTYNNFQAQVHEVGLELVLHANSLREKTGWDPYIFGGAHLVWNQTYGDLYNQDSTIVFSNHYAYSPNGMSKSEWKGLSDNIYDSALDGSDQTNYNVNFMPSIGIGLAYQVGPRFSVGIEHKTTFTLRNDFDGYQGTSKKWGMFKNDIYHYTSLMLKFNFRSRKVDNEIEEVKNDCLKPAIGIVTPVTKTLTVLSTQLDFEALISQIAGKNNIQFSLNGIRDTNFVYSAETSKMNKTITLIKGQNTINLTASNGCGTATETIQVLYEECVPPTVSFVNPSSASITTSEQNYTVTAKIERAKTIVYSINGKELRNYSFNEVEKTFSSTITLAEGENALKIIATNECGTQEAIVDVVYVRCDKPVIKINDGDRAIKVDNISYTANAIFQNISSKAQITLKLNGTVKTFAYNSSEKELIQKLTLKEGPNVIEISAKNDCGEVSQTINVEYAPCITPKITMILPGTSTTQTDQTAYALRAKIENISNANQVTVSLNGKSAGTGTYLAASNIFEKDINLIRGNNTVSIVVTTSCGTVNTSFTINSTLKDNDLIICFKGQTIVIKESQWNSYASQGATNGECPKPVDKNITICFKGQTLIMKESQWNSYASQGATQGECPKPVDRDITICFKGQTLIIKESQWNSYASQGATQGECPKPVDRDITICFKGQTLVIKESQWNSYASQGATQGECPKPVDRDITICFKGQTLIIKESQWNSYASQGATQGECPKLEVKDMTICLNGKTMVIKENEWRFYSNQGAIQGECPEPTVDVKIVICYNNQTMTINESQWAEYGALGAVRGECPEQDGDIIQEETVIICHVTGPDSPSVQMEIPVTELAAHLAHGDTQGPCVEVNTVGNDEMEICLNGVTKIIKKIEFAKYKLQGATAGPCN
jgi:hypothetical protein